MRAPLKISVVAPHLKTGAGILGCARELFNRFYLLYLNYQTHAA